MKINKSDWIVFLASFTFRSVLFAWLYFHYGGSILSFANSDALGYINNAIHLINGEGFREAGILSALRTPFYPLFLAGIMISGIPLLALPFIQALLFSFASVFVFRTGQYLFSQKAGLIAGLLFAFEPFMAVTTALATPETLFLFFLTLFTYLFSVLLANNEKSVLKSIASGLALGALLLTKPVAVYLPVPFAILLFVARWRRFGMRSAFISTAVFIFVFLAVLSPWLVRQKAVFDKWAISNSGTYMLYTRIAPIAVASEMKISYEEASRILLKKELPEKISGFDPNKMEYTFEYDEFLKRDAKERIASQKWAVAKFYLYSMGSGLFGGGYDYLIEELGFERQQKRGSFTQKLLSGDFSSFIKDFFRMDAYQSVVILGGVFWMSLYLIIAVGIIFGSRSVNYRSGLILIIMLALYFMFFALGPQARARYRMPSYPFLFLLAGYSFVWIFEWFKKRLSTLRIHSKYLWVFDFIDYSRSRIVTGLIGTVILLVFADLMGFNAWLVNLLWIPFSFVISFGLIRVYARQIDKSATGKLKKMLIKNDDEKKHNSDNSSI